MNSGECEYYPLSKEVGGCKGDLLFFFLITFREDMFTFPVILQDFTWWSNVYMYVVCVCVCMYLTKNVQQNEIYPYY